MDFKIPSVSNETVKNVAISTAPFVLAGAIVGKLVIGKYKGALIGSAIGLFMGVRTALFMLSQEKEEPKETAAIDLVPSDEAQA